MKVFTCNSRGINYYVIIDGEGGVFISREPYLYGGNFIKTSFTESDIINLCEVNVLKPTNLEAKHYIYAQQLIKKENQQRRNLHTIAVIICAGIAIGSIFMGVW